MATLNIFLFGLGERGLLFFKPLKWQDKFRWPQEAAQALKDLKQHLQSPPVLTTLLPGETSHRLPMSSAQPSWWNAMRKAMLSRCRGQSTSSAKYFLNQRFLTHPFTSGYSPQSGWN